MVGSWEGEPSWIADAVILTRHAGTDLTSITNMDGSVEVKINQQYYIDSMTVFGIRRATWGRLQCLALQTQQLCARCNLLASEITTKRLTQSALELQQLVGEIRKRSYHLHYKKPRRIDSWRDMVLVTFCKGKVTYMAPLAWQSWKLRRKAISLNDAEVQEILDGEDQNFRIRVLRCEMNGACHDLTLDEDRVEWAERMARGIKNILATGSKGGYDAVIYNELPMLGLSNARAALQALQLRGHLTRTGAELRWVASDNDLGDALTKKKAECRLGLIKFLQTGLWSVAYLVPSQGCPPKTRPQENEKGEEAPPPPTQKRGHTLQGTNQLVRELPNLGLFPHPPVDSHP